MKSKKTPKKIPRATHLELKHYKLTIAYVGTDYNGWQKQAAKPGQKTVQELIETAAKKVLKDRLLGFHGSGRTDSGVHARAQVAHLRARVDLPPDTLLRAINAHLPDDIRVLRLEEANPDFHAQLDVVAKTYRYFILNTGEGKDPIHWPFLRPYTWFVTYPLDLEKMREALAVLVGTHDFKSFQNTGTPVTDTTREILQAKLISHDSDPREAPPWMPGPEVDAKLIEIRIRGSGFLKQMVRTIVGTLVEIGRGKLEPSEMKNILEKRDRRASGMTAPPNGLFMDSVEY